MTKKRTYRSVDVQKVEIDPFVTLVVAACCALGIDPLRCVVAIDVAKEKFFAGFATAKGELVRIVRFEHPTQTLAFLDLLAALKGAGAELEVVMEPTGTYGDALAEQCEQRGMPVFMVSPKKTHDMAEVIDGVPSQHDAKSAVIIAQLHAMGKSARCKPRSQWRRELRALLERRSLYTQPLEANYGKLEALLARHWPELQQWVKLHKQRSWMSLLQQFPGPELVTLSSEPATELMRKASSGRLKLETIEGVVDSARHSLGVKMSEQESELLRELVAEIQRCTKKIDDLDKQVAEIVRGDAPTRWLAQTVGAVTAAVLVTYVGDPRDFGSAGAFEKACGLNLKIRSSGKHVGELKITKRGSGIARKFLYLAALRLIKDDAVAAAWYRNRKCYRAELKKKAVVAVMRKLVRALFHVARGSAFDSTKLFDTRRLNLDASAQDAKPTSAKATRGAARTKTGSPCPDARAQEVSAS